MTSAATTTIIPPQLAGLLALIGQDTDAETTGRTLEAVRAILLSPRDDGTDDREQQIEDALTSEAGRGAWAGLHAAIHAFGATENLDDLMAALAPVKPNAGDLINVYAEPALLLGLMLGYVYTAENGRAR